MSIVFVHGVPETSAVWDRVRAALDRDSVALRLPGFASPRPDGFNATMDEYAAWLAARLDELDPPIDLVGHDWGGILTTRLASTSPERLRSWVTDAVTPVDPAFEWHEFAKVWQTPGEGEAFWDGLRSSPEETAQLLSGMGVPTDAASGMAQAIDETMSAAILDLYRSAEGIGRTWRHETPVDAPGLVLVGSEDAFGNETHSRRVADRLGAHVAVIEGAGHWWLLEEPDRAVEELTRFWAGLD